MSQSKPLALVAEDTELGRWAIAHALRAGGFDTHLSEGWAESARWLDRVEFDVAVLSLVYDRDDVGHIAEHVRNHHSRTSLILLAPQDEIRAVRSACGPGPIVLAKPLDIDQIVQAARSVTGRDNLLPDAS